MHIYQSTALFIIRVHTRQIICHSALQFIISVTFPSGIELGWCDTYRHGNDVRSRQAVGLETDKWAVLGTLHNIQTEDNGFVLTYSWLSKLCSILLRQRGTSSQNNSTKQLKPDRSDSNTNLFGPCCYTAENHWYKLWMILGQNF